MARYLVNKTDLWQFRQISLYHDPHFMARLLVNITDLWHFGHGLKHSGIPLQMLKFIDCTFPFPLWLETYLGRSTCSTSSSLLYVPPVCTFLSHSKLYHFTEVFPCFACPVEDLSFSKLPRKGMVWSLGETVHDLFEGRFNLSCIKRASTHISDIPLLRCEVWGISTDTFWVMTQWVGLAMSRACHLPFPAQTVA